MKPNFFGVRATLSGTIQTPMASDVTLIHPAIQKRKPLSLFSYNRQLHEHRPASRCEESFAPILGVAS